MLKIRLKKYGRRKYPSYRIIVIDSRKRRDGRPLEEIGFHNPLNKQTTLDIEKAKKYIKYGAQTSSTVRAIYNKAVDKSNLA
uniref:Small ribosomal subunit protein bS16c n=1 Tax=Yamadaella caenomyce TaxID=259029 RepID=A0A1G4NZ19_9FLOR|nr:Ribosomal protein S16 [Yamadaella caenomyce]SCW23897.1 Ribosomal protein S16 [Yamadaella caenomyce]